MELFESTLRVMRRFGYGDQRTCAKAIGVARSTLQRAEVGASVRDDKRKRIEAAFKGLPLERLQRDFRDELNKQ